MNKVYLIGNLTRDPEMRTTGSGIAVCNFSIAVNRRFKNSQTGQAETDFFNIVAWRQLAELCSKYLAKGRKVAVFGALQSRTYEAQDGSKRVAIDIVADEVEFLGGNQQGSNQQGGKQSANQTPGAYTQAYPPAEGYDPAAGFTPTDDELPF